MPHPPIAMPQYLGFGTVIVDIVLNVHHIAKAELP